MNIQLEAALITGLILSMSRMAAFVVASPILARTIPFAGRMAFVLATGLAFARPVDIPMDVWSLIVAMGVNLIAGMLLGILTGLLFHLFEIAGELIDFTSSLSVAQTFDPMTGSRAGVFGRLFNLAALAIFLTAGGLRLLVQGLRLSLEAVPLDGRVALDPGLISVATSTFGLMMVSAIELAAPAFVALFLAELLLGIASRFAPQANVFLLGLPAKLVATLATISFVVLMFPEAVGGLLDHMERTFTDVLRGLS